MTWKERQAAAYAAMKDIRNKMDKGEWNADLNLEFERLSKDLAAAEQEKTAKEQLDAIIAKQEAEVVSRVEKQERIRVDNPDSPIVNERVAFNHWLARGYNGLSAAEKVFVKANEKRAVDQGIASVGIGLYLVPEDFMAELTPRLAHYGPFGVDVPNAPFRQITTQSGASMPWPTVDDTGNASYLLDEGDSAQTSQTDITFTSETLASYVHTTGLNTVSRQLLQDGFTDAGAIVAEILGVRMSKGVNAAMSTGTGSSQPEGISYGATSGVVTESSTAFTPNNVIDLKNSVDYAYWNGPKVGFMMHQNILTALQKLDTSTSNYSQAMWQPSFAAGQPSTILGHQYWVNNGLASAQALNAKIMYFGDFNYFAKRVVQGMTMQRLEERFAELNAIGIVGFYRFDSRVIGTGAIKYLENT